MYQQRVAIRYTDGTEREAVLTQWSMGQFAQWATRQGLTVDTSNPGLMGVVMLRYQAYCEQHRDPTVARPAFDKWDLTVAEVDPLGVDEPVDPTRTAASEG